ncbi:MAG: hypothetical protein AAFN77_04135 [Planctomycetota bacterium]
MAEHFSEATVSGLGEFRLRPDGALQLDSFIGSQTLIVTLKSETMRKLMPMDPTH